MSRKLIIPGLFIVALFISCNKDYVFDSFPTVRYTDVNVGTLNTLKSIAFLNSTEGFIAGEAGTILHTTDGGNSWSAIAFNKSIHINKILPLSSTEIYIATSAGIYYSTNGGGTWKGTNAYGVIRDICFKGTYGYACGGGTDWCDLQQVYQTTDGIDWDPVWFGSSMQTPYVNSFYFLTPDTGYAVGADNLFIKTVNGGLSWTFTYNTSCNEENAPDYKKIIYTDENNCYLAGAQGLLLKGDSKPWLDSDPPTGSNIKPDDWKRDLFGMAIRGNKGIAVGNWSVECNLSDLNSAWSDMLTPKGETFHQTWYDVAFVTDDMAMAVGKDGIVTKFYL